VGMSRPNRPGCSVEVVDASVMNRSCACPSATLSTDSRMERRSRMTDPLFDIRKGIIGLRRAPIPRERASIAGIAILEQDIVQSDAYQRHTDKGQTMSNKLLICTALLAAVLCAPSI